jgi:hypothetical protein
MVLYVTVCVELHLNIMMNSNSLPVSVHHLVILCDMQEGHNANGFLLQPVEFEKSLSASVSYCVHVPVHCIR